ncbi:MAG: hypothetical protein MJ252_30905 [archaeon]|nr:hypothetical protein [archaeon]
MRNFGKLRKTASFHLSMEDPSVDGSQRSAYQGEGGRKRRSSSSVHYNLSQPNERSIYSERESMELKYVCPDCMNREIAEDKRTAEAPKEYPMQFYGDNHKFDDFYQKRIKDREQLTKIAANETQYFKNPDKDNLQRENERGNFWLNNTDYGKLRANQRDKEIEKMIKNNPDKWNKPKEEEQKYYDKCVGKGNGELIKERPPLIDKEQFFREQKQQVEDLKKLRAMQNERDDKEDEKVVRDNQEKMDRQYAEENEKRQQFLRDMNDSNRKMILQHERQKKDDEKKRKRDEERMMKEIERKNKEDQDEKDRRRAETTKVYSENYKKFLNHKKEMAEQEKLQKEKDKNLRGLCLHGCEYGTCNMCKKVLPKTVLTAYKVPKKKEKKKNNLKY